MSKRRPPTTPFPVPLERKELARRIALAREPDESEIPKPRLRHMLAETLYLLEPVRRPLRQLRNPLVIPVADRPRTVMVLPGFATHPVRMRHFATSLEKAGHTVKRWGLGFNWGPTEENFELLRGRLADLHQRSGQQVHLVGWSLGGLFARELAKDRPEAVAKVISMGSPFSYSPRANNAWRIYQFIAGHSVHEPPIGQDVATKPPVPTVALWSPNDGIVHPRAACGKPDERDRAIALRCGHLGFAYSDEAILTVARELDCD
ncbi:esterase/lipase family protein [Parerythrobacter jejuensis]|uniref:Alpha/beta fold hydrolase n=1 Tax=Parerythrobacter jejuensis TaxID=795812 RepID=A0A845ATL1_9SPHN|nr:alpha/beta fold hydrolase [Parerythrobacter jejuensis]MXP32934.1 alpha/beta fold hydrolase [Parerythrobacter jejuensis]